MSTKKDRRHSGRKHSKIYNPVEHPYEQQEYNEWDNYRDGLRGYGDRTKKRSIFKCFADNLCVRRWNKKIKKFISRRKIMKKNKIFKGTRASELRNNQTLDTFSEEKDEKNKKLNKPK